MFSRCILITLLLLDFIPSISSISCYVCESTFPGSNLCIPPCLQSDEVNSTCQLTRNVPLDVSTIGSVIAGHIADDPFFSNALEKSFIFGEEAVYLNPSEAVGWDWEYGPITYGCDTPDCNDPQNVNRLPNALNARIPDQILNQYLVGDLDNSCYRCDTCLDENAPDTGMSACILENCPTHACNFIATRNSPGSIAQCGTTWHFSSGCIPSREYAQVDMTMMYYIRSQTNFLYQMAGVCLSDNCNNFTTFLQLKNAITVDPDLDCLTNSTTGSTITTPASTIATTTSTSTIATTTSASIIATTTSASIIATTTQPSSVDRILMNKKLYIFFLFLYKTIKY